MTVALFLLTVGGALLYASMSCAKFTTLLIGRPEEAPHCAGSLLVALVGLVALIKFGPSGCGLNPICWLKKVVPIFRPGRGGKGGAPPEAPVPPGEEPAPPENIPPPRVPSLPPPPPEIPIPVLP